ncbi:glycosyltransferase N-terminal domain-containing protein [uncultured Chitinophaga sp.]|uniref:3-deoxy-D-manno-octulosonic acid transferase n=1 Tax=uncultured Chitinophaga sp. TaxID=339340 RepID=UPI0025D5973C|nr:glycosyltransferase N-terminal domain-containing protein [uncultured Chitinophaga sp.]
MGLSVIIYNAGIRLYRLGVGAAALMGNKKAKKWIDGRRNVWASLGGAMEGAGKVVWVHAASLGEFEQGRPVMEAIRLQYPDYKLLLTFFSPSGYEVRKDYKGADYVCYLPLDTHTNARRFVKTVNPALSIFIKYEFWYHYLEALRHYQAPVLLISGIFRPGQVFFKSYGGMFRKLLRQMEHIFLQNRDSVALLQNIGVQHVTLAGDTRFDRVWELQKHPLELPLIAQFCRDQRVLVAGSTWDDDEAVLEEWWQAVPEGHHRLLIIAPHEISDSHIARLKERFPGSVSYSALAAGNEAQAAKVLIIDNVGMLSALYRYADITFVGGGFGKDGIHNLLEPAAYSKPVIIGPVYHKFHEAIMLVELGGAMVITNAQTLQTTVAMLENAEKYGQKASIAGRFIEDNQGATERIMHYIQEKRFLTIV